MKLPKISIVIPSFNKAKYIGETLQSIVNQKYPNLEVIIQDGGSNDGTLEIIKKYAKNYPKIFSYESKKDKGQTDAINKGFRKATGEIFAFINADDFYENGALQVVGEYFLKYPETVWLAGQGMVIDENKNEIVNWVAILKNLLLYFNKYSFLLIVNYLMQQSVFFSKKSYKEFGPLTGVNKAVMEYDLWLKIGKMVMPKVLRKNLSYFRLLPESFSISLNKEILSEDLKIVKKHTNNILFILLHTLNNLGRILVVQLIGRYKV